MQEAKIKIKRFIVCPGCGEGESSIQHLLDDESRPNFDGQWYCDHCGCSYKFRIEGDQVFSEVNPMKWKKPALTLLRLKPRGTVYAVVDDSFYDFAPDGGNKQFYYEESTCPTSVLSNIDYLIDGNNVDPHGIWEFLATVQHEPLDSNETIEDIAKIFHFDFSIPKLLR